MIHPKKLEATNKWDIDTGCFFMHVSRLVCVHQSPEQVMCHWFTLHGWCNWSGEHQLVALHSWPPVVQMVQRRRLVCAPEGPDAEEQVSSSPSLIRLPHSKHRPDQRHHRHHHCHLHHPLLSFDYKQSPMSENYR